jgi:hypothetical protein
MKSTCHLVLTLDPDVVPLFFQFLQRGVAVEAGLGGSVRTFLCEQLGLDPDYVDRRIQTVFLDGKTVDDLDAAILNQGSVLSLSAALPGLLGAVLRKGSHYGAMRAQISYRKETAASPCRKGHVILKLFNLLTGELGPTLFKRGLCVKGKDLGEFFKERSDRFWAGCRMARIDEDNVETNKLADIDWGDGMVLLQFQDR